jgi:hypothetical protein
VNYIYESISDEPGDDFTIESSGEITIEARTFSLHYVNGVAIATVVKHLSFAELRRLNKGLTKMFKELDKKEKARK